MTHLEPNLREYKEEKRAENRARREAMKYLRIRAYSTARYMAEEAQKHNERAFKYLVGEKQK